MIYLFTVVGIIDHLSILMSPTIEQMNIVIVKMNLLSPEMPYGKPMNLPIRRRLKQGRRLSH